MAARSLDSSSEQICPHGGRTHDVALLAQAAWPDVSPTGAAVPIADQRSNTNRQVQQLDHAKVQQDQNLVSLATQTQARAASRS
jgi:hypothetical protein